MVSLTKKMSTSSQRICQACCLTSRPLCYEHLSVCVRVQTLFSDHFNLFNVSIEKTFKKCLNLSDSLMNHSDQLVIQYECLYKIADLNDWLIN